MAIKHKPQRPSGTPRAPSKREILMNNAGEGPHYPSYSHSGIALVLTLGDLQIEGGALTVNHNRS